MWKSIGKIKKSEKEISEHLYEGEKKLNQSYGHETMEAERAKTGGTHRERPVQRTRKQEKRGGGPTFDRHRELLRQPQQAKVPTIFSLISGICRVEKRTNSPKLVL